MAQGVELAPLEGGDPDRAPTFGGAEYRAEHQLEHRLLAEGVGDDLQSEPFLDEQSLEEVGGADRPAVGSPRSATMYPYRFSSNFRTSPAESVHMSMSSLLLAEQGRYNRLIPLSKFSDSL